MPKGVYKHKGVRGRHWKVKDTSKMKGRIGYWLGKCRPEETKEKIRKKLKGRIVPQEVIKKISKTFKKTWIKHPEWKERIGSMNRGKPMSNEQKEKLRKINLERWDKIGRRDKRPMHDRWEYRNWKLKIFKRDNFTCKKCKKRGKGLRSHHIQNFSTYPKLRFLISNGLTLCSDCHDLFHRTYGTRNNTKEQIIEFIKYGKTNRRS